MEYIYKKTGKLISNAGEMKVALKKVYTEDMFEASLSRNNQLVSIGGVPYMYGSLLRIVDKPRFNDEYEEAIKKMAESFIVKGEAACSCADEFIKVGAGFNFTDAMMKMFDGETVWATQEALGLSTVDNHPYYFRIICGELCYTIDLDEPEDEWDAVACLLRHVNFRDEVWHALPEVPEEE